MSFELDVPISFSEAIARQEGFYIKGSRAARNHNPGDIDFGKFTQLHGGIACPADPRFAVFPDDATGFAALKALIKSYMMHNPHITIAEFFNRYAPPCENQTNAYTANVCKWIEKEPTDLVRTLVI